MHYALFSSKLFTVVIIPIFVKLNVRFFSKRKTYIKKIMNFGLSQHAEKHRRKMKGERSGENRQKQFSLIDQARDP
jgi:hypothetical protein